METKHTLKRDCHHCRRGECHILIEAVCGERKCSFYETKEEYKERQRAFRARPDQIQRKRKPKELFK